jgi:ABC-type lipoprotein release transport system permease subunit
MTYHLKIAIRNLQRNGLYSWINVVGLAVSIAAVVFIMCWVLHELSFDTFHKRSKDIYHVMAKITRDGTEQYWRTPTAVPYAARHEIPDVENACAVNPYYDLGFLKYQEKTFFDNRYITVDTTFFRIFDATFIEGSADRAFPDPYAVILTHTLAKKIFGDEPALGKTIIGSNGNNWQDDTYYVSAVVADCPKNAYLQYDAIFSFERSRHKNSWHNWSWDTYLLLRPGTDTKAVGERLREIQRRNFPQMQVDAFALQPLTDLRLHDAGGTETGIAAIRLFFIIACGLLLIACINYVNLTTARANKRSKEIAVRKIMGAKKRSLFSQLMNETLILCAVALGVALLLVGLLFPYYNQLLRAQLDFSLTNPVTGAVCGITLLLVVLLSGVYPAVKLMAFRTTDAFKLHPGRKTRASLRKILVVFQFTGVAMLLVTTFVINRQMHYIQHKSLGYDREHVLFMPVFTNADVRTHFVSFKSDLEQEPDIMGVSASVNRILYAGFTEHITWEGMSGDTKLPAQLWGVDRDIFSLLGIPLVEGSGFSGSAADSTLCYLNETAVQAMSLENPIGKRVSTPIGDFTVAGVVRDFDYTALQEPVKPMLLYLPPPFNFTVVYVKTPPGRTPEAMAAAERVWKKYNALFPFDYRFLDDEFNAVFAAEQQRQTLFSAFSLLAIFISCLGLFGLVSYTAETRTKEIGIRKVLGATVASIIGMLSKEFLLLVGIALLVALPTAWYVMEKMLQQYVYRISLSWWIFALAAVVVIGLTVLSVGIQAYRAATANPVEAIKTE